MSITLYLRDQGVICYEAPILDNQEFINEMVRSTGIEWFWESRRVRPIDDEPHGRNLPPERALTPLTASNLEILLDDLRERDVDGYGRFIAIFGVDPNEGSLSLSEAEFRKSLEGFAKQRRGPIRIVIVQVGDSPSEHVFVPHEPVEPVKDLMAGWGLAASATRETRKYDRLYTARLESVYRLN